MKKIVILFLVIFSLFFVPITYSKYTETVSKSFTLNIRQPQYYIAFRDNELNEELPSEYQEVSYIESTGKEYIDTEIIAKGTIGFEVSFFSYDKFTSSYPGYGSIFGGRTASTKNEIQVTTYSTTDNKNGTFRYGTTSNSAYINLNETNIISYLNEDYTVNGIVYNVPRTNFNSNQKITIFAVNNGGTITQYGKVRLQYLKLYDDNILVRDYIPCLRISDGEIGLYDTVSKTFFTNKGTGEFQISENSLQTFDYGTSEKLVANQFTRSGLHFINWNTKADGTGTSYEDEATILNLSSKEGDLINLYAQWKENEYYKIRYHLNANDLPEGYQEVEFIESTGTQYLNTGVAPKGTIGFETKFKTNNTYSQAEPKYGSIFGGRDDSQLNEVQLTTYISAGVNYGTFRYANASHEGNIELDAVNNIKYIGNDYTTNKGTYQLARETFTSPYPMTIFAVNDGGEIKQFGLVRLYKLKIYDGESLIRDYVPCYRISDNVIGLYDKVNNAFISNQGTGTFLKDKVQEFVYEVKTKLEKNEYEREGYTFHSWNTKPDGTGISFTDEQQIKYTEYIENDFMNLYAQWTPNENQ